MISYNLKGKVPDRSLSLAFGRGRVVTAWVSSSPPGRVPRRGWQDINSRNTQYTDFSLPENKMLGQIIRAHHDCVSCSPQAARRHRASVYYAFPRIMISCQPPPARLGPGGEAWNQAVRYYFSLAGPEARPFLVAKVSLHELPR